MENKLSFNPNIAIPPGDTLLEYLEHFEMTQKDLAERIGMTTKFINEVIAGKASITTATALKLESVFGTPASFWSNLQAQYDEVFARLEAEKEINEEVQIAKELPYNELAKLGILVATRDSKEKVKKLREFFGVASLKFIDNALCANFRTVNTDKVSIHSLAAWIRVGELKARNVKVDIYDEKKLKALINDFRKLTFKKPEEIIPEIEKLCASCGIVFTLVHHLPKSFAHGAVKWIKPEKVLLQMSDRCKDMGIFWFSFFHELGHILLHSKKQVFIEIDDKDEIEKEADNYSAKTLIPTTEYNSYVKKGIFIDGSIREFARMINIPAYIVLGRLQHDGKVGFKDFSYMKVAFNQIKKN